MSVDNDLELLESFRILPQRVNEPPIVILGCTLKELVWVICLTSLFWLSVMVPFLFKTTYGTALMGGFLTIEGLTVYVAGQFLTYLKRGKPRGYYTHKIRLFFEGYGFSDSHLFTHKGPMDLGRNKQYICLHSFAALVDEFDASKEFREPG